MKPYNDVVYHLGMCMNEDNPGPNNIKGDTLREKMICVGWGIL